MAEEPGLIIRQKKHKVVFMNKELGLRLTGLLRLPDGFDLSKNYPAIVITGPMLSVKEQAQSVYAERLTKAGYVTLVFFDYILPFFAKNL